MITFACMLFSCCYISLCELLNQFSLPRYIGIVGRIVATILVLLDSVHGVIL